MARKLANTIGTAILALILALVVWFGATSAANPAITDWHQGQVPIIIKGQPRDSVIVTPIESYAEVRITVPRDSWETVRPTDFIAYVDLSQVSVGETADVPVVVQAIKRGIRLVGYRPTSVTVRLEQYDSKTVLVRVNTVDEPPLGYAARDPVAEPQEVTVSGPISAVARVSYAGVDVWLRGAQQTLERSLPATAMDAEGSPVAQVSIVPSVVKVRVELTQRANFRPSVPVSVQLEGLVAPLYWISNIVVRPASITLVGLPSVLEQVPGYVQTEPVNISGATARVSQRVALKLPPGVSVVPESAQQEASQTVQVEVEVLPVTGGRTLQVPVSMQGLAPQYTASLSPEVIDVYLSGPLVQLQSLSAEQIEVTVNLLDLGDGSHQLTPTVIVPAGIELKGMVPEAVAVQIVGPQPTPTVPPPAETPTATTGG